MFSDAYLAEPDLILDIQTLPDMVEITGEDGIFFNNSFTAERRVRRYIYQLLVRARQQLPSGYFFMVFEGYRSVSYQKKLWDEIVTKMRTQHPDLSPDSEEFIALCDCFVANPYRQGSGHASGGAIDIALCDDKGKGYDMGGFVREFSQNAQTDADGLSDEAQHHRRILKTALESVGFINYPAEWWHYSFGDRLWAKLTKSRLAIFGPIDL